MNAGQEGSIVVQTVKGKKDNEGFNAQNEKYEDLIKAGVIDPTKVVRTALQNAGSIASLLLTTEALIAEIPEDKKESRDAAWRWRYGRHVLGRGGSERTKKPGGKRSRRAF